MTTIKNRFLWFTVVILLAIAAFHGCAYPPDSNPPPQTVALDTLDSIYNTTRDAYKQVAKLHIEGNVSAGDMTDIDNAWNKFRAGMLLAVQSAGGNWSSAPTIEVLKLKDSLFTLIKAL